MKPNLSIQISLILILFALLVQCKKEPIQPQTTKLPVIDTINTDTGQTPSLKITNTIGLYVLNEGLMNMNNASLSYYHFTDSVVYNNYFSTINNRKAGDTGNDLAIYGSKLYMVVSISGQVEVMDALTGKSLKQIALFNGNKNRQPRRIAFYENKAFVCCFDGSVAVIDTTTLEVDSYLAAGRNPDGITCANHKIYVSNSGGLSAPNYDNRITVFDAKLLTHVKEITVPQNPFSLINNGNNNIYLVTRGDYDKTKMALHIISAVTDSLIYTFPDIEVLDLAIKGDTALVYHYGFSTESSTSVMLLNLKTKLVIKQNFITDGTKIETPYGISIDTITNKVFITDAKGFINTGKVYCFSFSGQLQYSFAAGLNPGKMAFLRK